MTITLPDFLAGTHQFKRSPEERRPLEQAEAGLAFGISAPRRLFGVRREDVDQRRLDEPQTLAWPRETGSHSARPGAGPSDAEAQRAAELIRHFALTRAESAGTATLGRRLTDAQHASLNGDYWNRHPQRAWGGGTL